MPIKTQLNRGLDQRLMYVENKTGDIDGAFARIGYVRFSKSGTTIYYRDRELRKIKGRGVSGNFCDLLTGEEYWVSGVKKRGSNVHPAESLRVEIDEDALAEYRAHTSNGTTAAELRDRP